MSKFKHVKRWTAKRKQEVVLRLLRGESLDALNRETGQAAGELSRWREEFLEAGLAGLKRRTKDPKVVALEKELKRAQWLVGDLMMDKELLEMRIARFQGEPPFGRGRSRG
jgi:transposase-like protein